MQKGVDFITQKMLLQEINTKLNQAKIAITAQDTTYEQMVAHVNNLEGETGIAECNPNSIKTTRIKCDHI